MATPLSKQLALLLQQELIVATVYRTDFDRVDVTPRGSPGILRGLPLNGDPNLIQPGDTVRVIDFNGERVALAQDMSVDSLAQSIVDSGADLSGIIEGGATAEGALAANASYSSPMGDAASVLGYVPATSGANVHIPLTDVSGNLNAQKLGGYVPAVSGINQHVALTDPQGAVELSNISSLPSPATGIGALYMSSTAWPTCKNDAGAIISLGQRTLNIPISGWYPSGCTAQITSGNFMWNFRHSFSDTLYTSIVPPAGWKGRTVYFDFWWWADAGAGNVYWYCEGRSQLDSGALLATDLGGGYIGAAANVIKRNTISFNAIYNPTQDPAGLGLLFYRVGANASDTNLSAAHLLALRAYVL